MKKLDGKRFTNYYDVVNRYVKNKVLCNNITDIDASVIDNMRFEMIRKDGCPREIFQFFITDCPLAVVEFLENNFGFLFSYSDMCDAYILCVDHFGTCWKDVEVEILSFKISDAVIEFLENDR